ncbi:MAG: imelysin family protein, partial [Dongiaceae bacterium]
MSFVRAIIGLMPALLAMMTVASSATALDRATLNRSLALDYAAPRYQALAAATAALREAATSYCGQPDDARLATLRSAYDAAMDAWASAQPLRLGPVTVEKRLERLQFWPDKHNSGGKQFTQALQAMGAATVAAVAAGEGTVALQGFPAFERLLFDDKVTPGDAADPSGKFRCDLLAAIAANLANIAADTARAWGDAGQGFARSVI